jgi:uncharacterized cupredoxin-like copper-binding protein
MRGIAQKRPIRRDLAHRMPKPSQRASGCAPEWQPKVGASPQGDLPHHGAVQTAQRIVALGPAIAIAGMAIVIAACGSAAPSITPPPVPGTSAAPREVNIITRDYTYVPSRVDLVPGETVLFHVINGGLVLHEALLGTMDQQMAWEQAELVLVDVPPGPTPNVPPPAGFTGTRIVVASGQRLDVTWTVPVTAASDPGGWFVGCHIPGHWAKGMVVPVRLVDDKGNVLPVPGGAASQTTPSS